MKFIEKNKNVLITIVVMSLILVAYIASDNRENKEIKLETNAISCENIQSTKLLDYKSAACGEQKKIVYVMKTGCTYCEKIEPIKNEIIDKYKLNVLEIDTAEFDNTTINEFINTNDFLKKGEWGTPLFMIVENGKVIETLIGYKEKPALIEFFKKNGLIDE